MKTSRACLGANSATVRPVIAVLMPVFNPDPAELRRTLASLAAQTEPADLVIVDDGSTPPIRQRLKRLGIGANATVLRLPANVGITAALNHGLAYIIGRGYTYLARMDCGDACRPERLFLQRRFMDDRPEIDLVGAFAEVVDEAGAHLFYEGTAGGTAAIRNKLFDNAAFKHPTFFLRTRSLERLGPYSDHYRFAEDYELQRRFAVRGRLHCMDAVLVVYEKCSRSISQRRRGRQLASRLRIQLSYFEPAEPRAYAGLLRTLVTMALPATLWGQMARRYWRARALPSGESHVS